MASFAVCVLVASLREPLQAQSSAPTGQATPMVLPPMAVPMPMPVPGGIRANGISAYPPATNGAPTLAVSGHGFVVRVADRATVSVYVQSSGATAEAGLTAATKTVAAIAKVVEHLRGAQLSVNSSTLSYSASTGGSNFATFGVVTNVTITLDDLSRFDEFKQTLGSIAGAQLLQIRFDLRDSAAANAEAMDAAISDARSQVDALTAKSALKVTGVHSMQVYAGYNGSSDRSSIRIEATANATYDFATPS